MIEETGEYKEKSHGQNFKVCVRQWQRFINAKHIVFKSSQTRLFPNSLVLNKLSMFGHVDTITGCCLFQHFIMFKVLLGKCANKMKHYDMDIMPIHAKPNVLPALKLLYTQHIVISGIWFFINWSNICQTLVLNLESRNSNEKLGIEWCNHVIDNCDCIGVKLLQCKGDIFSDNYQVSSLILEKLALKFRNLKKFEIFFEFEISLKVLLLWQLLKPIIDKNEAMVTFTTSGFIKENDQKILYENIIKNGKNGLKITTFSLDVNDMVPDISETFKKIIQCKGAGIQCLKLGNTLIRNDYLSLSLINNVLTQITDILDKSSIYCKVNFRVDFNEQIKEDKDFVLNFEKCCQNIVSLIKKRIAIDICIIFRHIDNESQFDQCKKTSEIVFDVKEMFDNCNSYQVPKCNEYCKPVLQHQTSVKWEIYLSPHCIKYNQIVLRVFNARDVLSE